MSRDKFEGGTTPIRTMQDFVASNADVRLPGMDNPNAGDRLADFKGYQPVPPDDLVAKWRELCNPAITQNNTQRAVWSPGERPPGGPAAGKKYDTGKAPLVQGCLRYFPDALEAVARISEYGRSKYGVQFFDKNWKHVEDGIARYEDAEGRHLGRVGHDPESDLLHAAHAAWNALAVLQLLLDKGEPLSYKTEDTV